MNAKCVLKGHLWLSWESISDGKWTHWKTCERCGKVVF